MLFLEYTSHAKKGFCTPINNNSILKLMTFNQSPHVLTLKSSSCHLVGRPSESEHQYSKSLGRSCEAHGNCSGWASGCIWCYDLKNQGVGGTNSRPSGGIKDHTQQGKPTYPSHSFAYLLCERIDLFNKKWIFQYFISWRYELLIYIHL